MRVGRWRWVAAALAVSVGLLLGAGDPTADAPRAEALGRLRAKINWTFPDSCPKTLRDRILSEANGANSSKEPYRFCKDAMISRQSNPNAAGQVGSPGQPPPEGQVVPGALFHDVATFTPTQDVKNAVIKVDQGNFGQQRSVHVRVKFPDQPDSAAVTQISIDGSDDEPALLAGIGVDIEILSQVPLESQIRAVNQRAPTKRLFTSTIRVAERASGGVQTYNLNKPLIVRTEMQLNDWARRNLLPTPTIAGAFGGR